MPINKAEQTTFRSDPEVPAANQSSYLSVFPGFDIWRLVLKPQRCSAAFESLVQPHPKEMQLYQLTDDDRSILRCSVWERTTVASYSMQFTA